MIKRPANKLYLVQNMKDPVTEFNHDGINITDDSSWT